LTLDKNTVGTDMSKVGTKYEQS